MKLRHPVGLIIETMVVEKADSRSYSS